MEITFRGQYLRKDFARAVSLANGPSRRGTALRATLGLVFAAIFAYLVYDYLSGGDYGPVWLVRRGWSFAIVAYVLFSPYVSNLLLVRRLWNDKSNRSPVLGRLDAAGLTFLPSDVDPQYKWEGFARLSVEPDMMVLVTADGTFAPLPRSFFASDSDWERACQLAQSRVKPAK